MIFSKLLAAFAGTLLLKPLAQVYGATYDIIINDDDNLEISFDSLLDLDATSDISAPTTKCEDNPTFVKKRGGRERTCAYIGAGNKAWRIKKWCNKKQGGIVIKEICCKTCEDVKNFVYVKKYTRKWPNCENIECADPSTNDNMKSMCDQYANCSGFSFSTGVENGIGNGCLKKCGNNEGSNGYGSGTHDYWEKVSS